jgi:hypothetical protein
MRNIIISSKESLKSLFQRIVEMSSGVAVDEEEKQDSTEEDLNSLFGGETKGKPAQGQSKQPTKKQPDQNKQTPEQPSQDAGGSQEQKGDISLDQVIDKFNIIRGGKSFKEQDVKTQLEKYWNEKLDDAEKVALYTFAKGISQIVNAGIPAQQAADPSDAPSPGIKMQQTSKEKVKHVKPTVVRKGAGGQVKKPASKENTAAPKKVSPIQPKQRA